ncbi:hypothetical protein A3709_18945 [Halioglobus sp. HI00S01]|uniref:hypothetical protein n=1 Tax=Halioglobus sp. HI00S01 TaxID=1822214 RepID=UPI0007C30BCF|nr:hypothetical protein [Halioglobus sp. HI00S01]KZX57702.1 hypothetical protein A3709_18945 [Halioglobus sp. HI00S01]
MSKNRVISAYQAIVDGKTTGLAGCDQANSCPRPCLRKDPQLARGMTGRNPASCKNFIVGRES